MGGGGSFSAGGPGKGMYTRLYTHVLNRFVITHDQYISFIQTEDKINENLFTFCKFNYVPNLNVFNLKPITLDSGDVFKTTSQTNYVFIN